MTRRGDLSSSELSSDETQRYARHLILPQVGVEGQLRLKAASCLIVGVGGLGSPAAMYLAAAGVGRIGLVDDDRVELSNLQRQIIHASDRVGTPKTDSAAQRLSQINPQVVVDLHPVRLSSANAMEIIADYDIVLDGTDNFATRYLVNDVCVLLGKPNCYGSILQFDGQASVFATKDGPCYRCLYPSPPDPGVVPSCAEGGVLGVLPGLVGVIQATEAIKVLLGAGSPLVGRLLLIDALEMEFRELQIKRDAGCPVCGDRPTIRRPVDYDQFCQAGSESSVEVPTIVAGELAKMLHEPSSFTLLDVREPSEYAICNLGGRLIPLGELDSRSGELDRGSRIVVHCKSGGRSAKAVRMLLDHGFVDVRNLDGGIMGWASEFDPKMTRY